MGYRDDYLVICDLVCDAQLQLGEQSDARAERACVLEPASKRRHCKMTALPNEPNKPHTGDACQREQRRPPEHRGTRLWTGEACAAVRLKEGMRRHIDSAQRPGGVRCAVAWSDTTYAWRVRRVA
jgi:hypothetical protein